MGRRMALRQKSDVQGQMQRALRVPGDGGSGAMDARFLVQHPNAGIGVE